MYYKMEVLETVFMILFYPKNSFNIDDITNENNKEHNSKWQNIPDHPYRMLITGGSGSGKTNALLNSMKDQDDNDNIYLYARYLSEPKHEFLIKRREHAGIEHLNSAREFIEYSVSIDDTFSNVDDYNPSRKRKILIVFNDMIVDIMTNKKT